MLTGLSTASNAMNAFQTQLDNTANNLANMNTTAFKRNVVSFQDFVYGGLGNNQVGTGVRVASVGPLGFAQGTVTPTGRDTDVAINGKGFLVVALPNGAIQYTRDGSLHRDSTGRLVTNDGNILQPPITIPADTLTTTITADGSVMVVTSSAPSVPKVIGQIQLASFVNQEGLKQEAGNLYSETIASGPATIGTPGAAGLGQLEGASLEQSNVDVTTELTSLVTSQQAYVANSKVITTTNQMLTSTMGLIQ